MQYFWIVIGCNFSEYSKNRLLILINGLWENRRSTFKDPSFSQLFKPGITAELYWIQGEAVAWIVFSTGEGCIDLFFSDFTKTTVKDLFDPFKFGYYKLESGETITLTEMRNI